MKSKKEQLLQEYINILICVILNYLRDIMLSNDYMHFCVYGNRSDLEIRELSIDSFLLTRAKFRQVAE